jgi:hypothetical protein
MAHQICQLDVVNGAELAVSEYQIVNEQLKQVNMDSFIQLYHSKLNQSNQSHSRRPLLQVYDTPLLFVWVSSVQKAKQLRGDFSFPSPIPLIDASFSTHSASLAHQVADSLECIRSLILESAPYLQQRFHLSRYWVDSYSKRVVAEYDQLSDLEYGMRSPPLSSPTLLHELAYIYPDLPDEYAELIVTCMYEIDQITPFLELISTPV